VKLNQKLSVGTVLALSVVAVPTIVAHADEGVVTNDFSVKDKDGKVIKEFKSNETIQLKTENDSTYQIDINGQAFSVPKESILKTIKHEEESLSLLQENITLKASPDLFGNTLLQLNKGETIHRIDEVNEENGFVKVRTSQSVEGWVLKSALKQNIRNVPVNTNAFIDDDSAKSQSIFYGDTVTIIGFENNQYKLSDGEKETLVNKEAISFKEPPKRIIKPKIASSSEKADSHNKNLSDRVIDKAYEYMGVPYVWGGTTPNGFDCSGFTQYVLGSQGVSIPRVASDQARVGQTVDRNKLQKGDMIFFTTYKAGPSHVGFYIGKGNFIHAGGDRVQVSNLGQSYWSERYLWAKRMF
jgi:cell wall-associated NlpC family hydrolase